MFERYTEKARRAIFFARYEASMYGSPCIETEHLLLGLLREDRFLRPPGTHHSIRTEIESRITIRERISTAVEVPLSQDSRRVLNLAAEEAENLGHGHVGTEHLLLGLLGVETGLAARLLLANGVRVADVRDKISRLPLSESPKGVPPRQAYVMHSPRNVGTPPPEMAQVFLQRFLEKLRVGMECEFEDFFSLQAQYIDASGTLFLGQTFATRFKELLASFVAADARYQQEATLETATRFVVCGAGVGWGRSSGQRRKIAGAHDDYFGAARKHEIHVGHLSDPGHAGGARLSQRAPCP